MAPKGALDDIIAKLNATVTDILREDEVKDQFEKLGVQADPVGVDATVKFIAAERVRWREIIQSAHVMVD